MLVLLQSATDVRDARLHRLVGLDCRPSRLLESLSVGGFVLADYRAVGATLKPFDGVLDVRLPSAELVKDDELVMWRPRDFQEVTQVGETSVVPVHAP